MTGTAPTPVKQIHHEETLKRQFVNSTKVFLDYQIENAGQSGVGKVEVWMTRDRAKSWQKVSEQTQRKSPVEVQLPGEGLYGGGDITGIYGFTHVSHYHGVLIAQSLRGEGRRADHSAIPRVTFTDPEVASVGVSEAAAREAGLDVRVARSDVATSGRGYIHDVKHGFVKLVADGREGVLVGATLFTPRAGEMIAELSLAVRAKIPLKVLDDHVHGFPTFSRILQGAFHQLV